MQTTLAIYHFSSNDLNNRLCKMRCKPSVDRIGRVPDNQENINTQLWFGWLERRHLYVLGYCLHNRGENTHTHTQSPANSPTKAAWPSLDVRAAVPCLSFLCFTVLWLCQFESFHKFHGFHLLHWLLCCSRFTGRFCPSLVISRMACTACYDYTCIYIYIYIWCTYIYQYLVLFFVLPIIWKQVSICCSIYPLPIVLGMGGWGYFRKSYHTENYL